MVTIHVPQYNDNLINIVAYTLKNYPNKKDLSKARVTKMVYLVD